MDFSEMTVGQVKEFMANQAPNSALVEALESDGRKGLTLLAAREQKRLDKIQADLDKVERMRAWEKSLHDQGYQFICGVDEVGRGPLAGPVVTAAVILPEDFPLIPLDDSKALSASQRQAYLKEIEKKAIAIGIGERSAQEIDQSNILQATKDAMIDAINSLDPKPNFAMIDAVYLDIDIPQENPTQGDSRVYAIAAASIVAKEYRDQVMAQYDEIYPGYGFKENVGYGTKVHLEGIDKLGPCPIHRMTFAPLKNL